MGRIKQSLIKRTAHKLVGNKDIEFSEDFEVDKKLLGSTMPSKPLRNKIAGYIARLKKFEKRDAILEKDKINEVEVGDVKMEGI